MTESSHAAGRTGLSPPSSLPATHFPFPNSPNGSERPRPADSFVPLRPSPDIFRKARPDPKKRSAPARTSLPESLCPDRSARKPPEDRPRSALRRAFFPNRPGVPRTFPELPRRALPPKTAFRTSPSADKLTPCARASADPALRQVPPPGRYSARIPADDSTRLPDSPSLPSPKPSRVRLFSPASRRRASARQARKRAAPPVRPISRPACRLWRPSSAFRARPAGYF